MTVHLRHRHELELHEKESGLFDGLPGCSRCFLDPAQVASSLRSPVARDIPPDIISRSPILQFYFESPSSVGEASPVPPADLGHWWSLLGWLSSSSHKLRSLPFNELLRGVQVRIVRKQITADRYVVRLHIARL